MRGDSGLAAAGTADQAAVRAGRGGVAPGAGEDDLPVALSRGWSGSHQGRPPPSLRPGGRGSLDRGSQGAVGNPVRGARWATYRHALTGTATSLGGGIQTTGGDPRAFGPRARLNGSWSRSRQRRCRATTSTLTGRR